MFVSHFSHPWPTIKALVAGSALSLIIDSIVQRGKKDPILGFKKKGKRSRTIIEKCPAKPLEGSSPSQGKRLC